MNKEAKAEEELMLSVVRGIIDKHGPNGLYEDFNAFERRVEEMQKTLTDIQSRCAENSSIWAMAERTLQSLKGANT